MGQLVTIFKQSSWLFLAQGINRVIGFSYNIFLAKILGVNDFGLYSVALTSFSLISIFAEFGFNRYMVRQISLDSKAIPTLVCNVAILRLTLTSIIFAIFAVILILTDPDPYRTSLILLSILAVFPLTVAHALDSIFVGVRKLQFSAVSLIITAIVSSALGVFLVSQGYGATGAIVSLIFGQLAYLLSLFLLLKFNKVKLLSKVKSASMIEIVKGSFIYGVLGLLGFLYFRIDTLMLSYLSGNYQTGIYSAAYKFLEGILFIPSAIEIAIFPVMAKLNKEKSHLYDLYLQSIKLMFLISLPFLVGFFVVVPFLLARFLPSYADSLQVVRILSLSIPWIFLLAPQGGILLSNNRVIKKVIIISVFNLVVNVVGNLVLIPRYGVNGAAWMTVISHMIAFLLFSWLIYKNYKKDNDVR